MAVTLDVAQLASAIRVGDPAEEVAEVRRLLASATEAVTRYAPDAPDAMQNEAVVRLAGYWFDRPQASRGDGYAAALRNSGGASLLSPYRIRRAGSIGEAVEIATQDAGQPGNPVVNVQVLATEGELVVTFADGTTRTDALPAGMGGGGGTDQVARDAAARAQTTADGAATMAAQATGAASTATTAANSAQADIDAHKASPHNLDQTARDAAAAAETAANGAATAAATAQDRADNAFSRAANALSTANNAVAHADSAGVAAQEAQTRADSAFTLAQQADTKADTATVAAAAAQATADGKQDPLVPPSPQEAEAGTATDIRGWTAALIRAAINAVVPPVFRTGNTDPIPASKLTNAPGGIDQTARDAAAAAQTTADGADATATTANIAAAQAQVDATDAVARSIANQNQLIRDVLYDDSANYVRGDSSTIYRQITLMREPNSGHGIELEIRNLDEATFYAFYVAGTDRWRGLTNLSAAQQAATIADSAVPVANTIPVKTPSLSENDTDDFGHGVVYVGKVSPTVMGIAFGEHRGLNVNYRMTVREIP